MDTEVLFSSSKHDWMTPPGLLQAVLRFEGRTEFDMDTCCTLPNVPAVQHITQDSLDVEWAGLCWCNPPYGSTQKDFIAKAFYTAADRSGANSVWCLIPARTDTKLWQDLIFTKAAFVVFLGGRLKFLQMDGTPADAAPFPSALVYFGRDGLVKYNRWAKEKPLPGKAVYLGE